MKRQLIGTPDMVTGPSQHVIDTHLDHGFFTEASTQSLPLGIDSETIVDTPTRDESSRSVLYAGVLSQAKGLETLLDAAEELSDVDIHICGEGPYAKTVEARTASMENVTCHGFVSETKLSRLREQAWIAVVPSIWMDNSPFVIYESFAKGLPVVGSNIGGIPELIAPGEQGELFGPGDVDELVEAIQHATEPTTNGRMGEKAIEWASQHTIDKHVTVLLDEIYTAG